MHLNLGLVHRPVTGTLHLALSAVHKFRTVADNVFIRPPLF